MSKEHREAATAELREFLAQMRGKSPSEMLGAIASSNLVQSTLIATAAITATIVILTVIPFGWKRTLGKAEETAAVAPAEVPDANKALETPAEPDLDSAGKGDAAGKLGIGESKDAPANVNPLESSNDDLLEGLE